MACLSLRKRKGNDLLAAIILPRDVSLVHVFQRPAIKVAKTFITDLKDSAASGYGLADRRKPHGDAFASLVQMPPATERQGEVRKIHAGYVRSIGVIVVETAQPGF
jgi:hypothetical protein